MLTSLCCGKFLANTRPSPSLRPLLTPLTGVFTLREQISCLHTAVMTSSSSLNTDKIAPRSFSAGIDTALTGGREGWLDIDYQGLSLGRGSHPRLTIFLIGWHSSSLISTPVICIPLLRGRLRCAPGEILHEPVPWRYLIYTDTDTQTINKTPPGLCNVCYETREWITLPAASARM